jgi:uncharacterized protein (DUF1697 family)
MLHSEQEQLFVNQPHLKIEFTQKKEIEHLHFGSETKRMLLRHVTARNWTTAREH